MKVVADRDIPFLRGVLEPDAEVVYHKGTEISKRDLQDADALVTRTRTKCDADLLEGTTVRFIASATIGFDHIDTEYCGSHGITWTNAPGCNSSSVEQYLAAALFHLSRKRGLQLAGKTIGIVGVGHVGSKVAKFCQTLGMEVLLNDPPRERREGAGSFVPLSTILARSDIVTLHVPLNRVGEDKTFHLVDRDLLSRMKKNQILINTSRGEVVETDALKSTLKRRQLAACALDVWENEPSIDLELLEQVDVATPHIAGYSADGKANGTAMSVQALSRFFELKLDHWYPKEIPPPENSVIVLAGGDVSSEETARRAVEATYDLVANDRKLRSSPETFERQRAEYPNRREFPAYTVRLRNGGSDGISILQKLGFQKERKT